MMDEIYYVYPKYRNMSFSIIAREHIARLGKKVKIQEIDEEVLDNLQWLRTRNILLHPILYVTIGDRANLFEERQKRLVRLLKVKGKLGGFETADSDKVSSIAIEQLNKVDVAFLPSNWAIKVFQSSGANIPLIHIPHGVSDIMTNPDKTLTNESILKIKEIKDKNNAILVLFFLMHSEYRKGADLVYEAMEFMQQKNKDLVLVLKRGGGNTVLMQKFKKLRVIEIPTWMPDIVLRQLYDACDMLLCPSRGGGFELNALEGLARGLPTLVPNAGCFQDYVDYAVPLPITGTPQVFPDNPIHQGVGWETNPDYLADTIDTVASNLEAWKEKAAVASEEVRKIYSWGPICEKLHASLVEHHFCNG